LKSRLLREENGIFKSFCRGRNLKISSGNQKCLNSCVHNAILVNEGQARLAELMKTEEKEELNEDPDFDETLELLDSDF
jgi:hypothetical protein